MEGNDENGGGCVSNSAGAGAGGGWGGGQGFGGSSPGGAGGIPKFNYESFVAPTFEAALNDPGYKFGLQQGVDALERSAAAKGTLRTGGTLQGIEQWGQDYGAQRYNDVYNRALQAHAANFAGQQAEFAPQYGGWQTLLGNELSRWQTGQSSDLQKYLQKEQNINDLLSTPPPTWGE